MPPKAGDHSILPCAEGCGDYVRPKRMSAEAAIEAVQRLHGPDAKVKINTGKAICSTCRAKTSPYKSVTTKSEQKRDRQEAIAAERLELARLAAQTMANDRARRAQANRVRRVSMGQSMVRI
jgi:hypothetical protein